MSIEMGFAALTKALIAGPVIIEAPGETNINCRATRQRY